MTDLVQVQKSLIDYIKANSSSLSVDPVEIRELEWQGDKFSYPNIRVRVETLEDVGECYTEMIASVYVFGDEKSSLQVNTVLDALHKLFSRKMFSHESVRFVRFSCVRHGAQVSDDGGSWAAKLQLKSNVS